MNRMRRILVVAMVIGSLLVTEAPSANAATTHSRSYTWTAYSALGIKAYSVSESVTWTVKTAGECGSLYPCFGNVSWARTYSNGSYRFDHWYTNVNTSGTLANGVKWRRQKVRAQFSYCPAPSICSNSDGWVWIQIYTDGTSVVNGGNT